MRPEVIDTQPWYKQFWPWFVLAIPATSVVVSMFFIYFAVNGADTLVVDDYYKQGLAINQELSRIDAAADRSINAQLNFNIEDAVVALNLNGTFSALPESLTLEMIHPTLQKKDLSIVLTKSTARYYTASLTELRQRDVEGNWHLHLSTSDEDWLIKSSVTLPSAGPILLTP